MRNSLVFTSCLGAFCGLAAAGAVPPLLLRFPQDAAHVKSAGAGADRPPQQIVERDGAALYQEGCERLKAGDAEIAIGLLSQAVAKRPQQIEYPLKLAEAYMAANRLEAAQRLLENLKKQQPRHRAVLLALGRLHAQRNAWQTAADILAPCADALDVDGVLLLAQAHHQLGQAAQQTETLQQGLKRWPQQERLWLAHIDSALERKQYAGALECVAEARRRMPPAPAVDLRAAQAYFHLGQALGKTEIRPVPGGRAGQFVGEILLVEERDGAQRFLCCPAESALYQIRRALDGGLDEPAAHLLHAQIWRKIGRAKTGLAVLKNREAVLLESADAAVLETFSALALEAGALSDYLRYARLRGERQAAQREAILYDAYLAVAERYNQRGEEAAYLEFLRRAWELRPDNLDLLLQLADANWAAGRHDAAAQLYRRLLECKPGHPEQGRMLQCLATWQMEGKP